MSLYTPQVGETSPRTADARGSRARVVDTLRELRERFPKLQMPRPLLDAYLEPPASPDDCIFAQTTDCVSADLQTRITPCQFGGTPDCSSCGCMASAGLAAVGRHRLGGMIPIDPLFDGSIRVGQAVNGLRHDAGPSAMSPTSERRSGDGRSTMAGAARRRSPRRSRSAIGR